MYSTGSQNVPNMGNMTMRKGSVGGGVMQRIQLKNVAFMPGKAPLQSPMSSGTTMQPGGPNLVNINGEGMTTGKASPSPHIITTG
jgi:hypothetical protein